VFIGARFVLQPEPAATGHGVPSQQNAYLSIKGLRDFSYGVLGLALLALTDAHATALFMLVVATRSATP
jgi:hypothetical protein